MKSKATLKQIAKELQVSVSTVSKALNDSPEISEQTKTKIQEYAKLKNYKPNVIGLNLKNRKTKTIGVILPNILNPFFAKVFTGIEKVAEEKGYNMITCISNVLADAKERARRLGDHLAIQWIRVRDTSNLHESRIAGVRDRGHRWELHDLGDGHATPAERIDQRIGGRCHLGARRE